MRAFRDSYTAAYEGSTDNESWLTTAVAGGLIVGAAEVIAAIQIGAVLSIISTIEAAHGTHVDEAHAAQ